MQSVLDIRELDAREIDNVAGGPIPVVVYYIGVAAAGALATWGAHTANHAANSATASRTCGDRGVRSVSSSLPPGTNSFQCN